MVVLRSFGFGMVLAALVALMACSPGVAQPDGGVRPSAPEAPTELAVVASFYPLYEVAKRVGGDRVEVSSLLAAGGEAHDLELSPRDLDGLRQARLLLYAGGGFQPGLERALQTLDAPDLRVVDILEGMDLIEGDPDAHAHEHDEEHAEEHADEPDQHDEEHQDEHHGDEPILDPHVWLDPLRMREITATVAGQLAAMDPDGQALYQENALGYQEELDALHREFEQGLRDCARDEIVVSHAAFGYLAQRYGLEQIPITGLHPEAEPSPQRLREIVAFAREHGITVIYFETLVSPRVAETIAREVGASTMVLNPIEGLTLDEQTQGKGYVDLMLENLANLRVGLECS